jgi:hypothetical protein
MKTSGDIMRNRLFLKCLHCSVSMADKVSKALLAFPEGTPKPMMCRRKSEHVGAFSQWVHHKWVFFAFSFKDNFHINIY